MEAASFQQTAGQALERELTGRPSPQLTSDALAPVPPIDAGLIGRLEIPRLRMSVVVMEGDDDPTLARAVGHVPGTALPWDPGNTVLAGHRDTFFRPLRNLRDGDEIRVTTTRGTFDYRVISTEIVEPDDVSVLAPTASRSLTLVTCYPFVYVGQAPQRFIIHASPRAGF
jgi:sortase A